MKKHLSLILLLFGITVLFLNCGNETSQAIGETQGEFIDRIKNNIESHYNCKVKITGAIKLKTSNNLNTMDIKIDSLENDSLFLNEIASKVTLSVFEEIINSPFKEIFLHLEVSAWEDAGTSSWIYETSVNQYLNLKKQMELNEKFLTNWKDKKFTLNYPLFEKSLEISENDSTIKKSVLKITKSNGEIKNWLFKGYKVRPGQWNQNDVNFIYPTYLINFKDTTEYFQLTYILSDTISKPIIVGTQGVF